MVVPGEAETLIHEKVAGDGPASKRLPRPDKQWYSRIAVELVHIGTAEGLSFG